MHPLLWLLRRVKTLFQGNPLGSNSELELSLIEWISMVCKQYNYQLCSKGFKMVPIRCNQF